MNGKTVVITGANAGIGKATATELARRGAQIVMLCRNRARAEAAREEIAAASHSDRIDLVIGDLADLASIRAAADTILARHERLDVLINNAGIYLPERSTTVDGFESTFQINHLGHFLLTRLLSDRLAGSAPSRIVNLSSGAHHMGWMDFGDLQSTRFYTGMTTYSRWKLGNILFTRTLARRFAGTGVTANAVHPGPVASEFAQDQPGFFGRLVRLAHPFLISVEDGARTSIFAASSAEVATTSGEYFFKSRRARVSRRARNDADAERLWLVSEELVRSFL